MKLLFIGTESIAFQSGAFFKDLTLLVQDLRAAGDKSQDAINKWFLRVDRSVYDHTGITTNGLFWPGGDNAAMVIPTMTRGNVLNRAEFNKFVAKKFDADKLSFYNLEKQGWIDPANSRVGGAFSEIVFKMIVGELFLFGKTFTPEEAATVILHEVGHAYTFLQFIADTVVINAVLQRTWAELTSGTPDKKVRMILTKAADDMAIQNKDWLQSIEDGTAADVAFKVLATVVAIEPRLMDNKRYFSMDAAEELADIFAARHGAGRAVVTMRSKFMSADSRSYGVLAGVAYTFLGVALMPFVGVIGLPVAMLGALLTYCGVAEASKAPDLSTFKQLSLKMRNQFVERIKLMDLPKEELVEEIASIDLVDKIVQGYHGDADPAMLVKFLDMFRRGKMDARASRDYTDKLESLAANDLFIRAAQLGSVR